MIFVFILTFGFFEKGFVISPCEKIFKSLETSFNSSIEIVFLFALNFIFALIGFLYGIIVLLSFNLITGFLIVKLTF